MTGKRSTGSRSLLQKKRNMKKAESDEPTAKTSRKTPTFLNATPNELLLNVFKKFPSATRVRMRRTSSFMNNFIDHHRKSLARTFCDKGVTIEVIVKKSVVTFKRNRERQRHPICNLQKMVSGLSIKRLSLIVHDNTPFHVIEDAFKNLDLVANVVGTSIKDSTVRWTPEQYLTFSNLAEALEAFYMNYGPIDLAEYLPSLKQSRNLTKLIIGAEEVSISRDIDMPIVEFMMNFRVFRFKLDDISFFQKFLWALHGSSGCHLMIIHFQFPEINGSLFNDVGFPPMKILWDLKSFDDHETPAPLSIRLMSSEKKWIVITEHFSLFTATQRIGMSAHVEFLEKNDESGLFDFLVPQFSRRKFTARKKAIYMKASPGDRFDMLRRAYYDHMKKEGVLQQEKFHTYQEYLQKKDLIDLRNL